MSTQSSLYIHLVTPIQTCVFQWVSASYPPFTNIWHANWSSQTFALVDELLDFLSYTDSAESWRPRRIMHRNHHHLTPLCDFTWLITLWLRYWRSQLLLLCNNNKQLTEILKSKDISQLDLLHRWWRSVTLFTGSNSFFHTCL